MADTLPIDTSSPAVAALAPAPLVQLDADLKALADRRQMDADCEMLLAAREASHSPSDRIAYALAAVLVTHPGCCTPKKTGGTP